MVEVYDREKAAAALLKEAREISVGLKTEMAEIATLMSRILNGGEQDADIIEEAAPGPEDRERPLAAIPAAASQDPFAGKSFWQFWR